MPTPGRPDAVRVTPGRRRAVALAASRYSAMLSRRPRRGRAAWARLSALLPDMPGSTSPSLGEWAAAAHELCHASMLRLRPPWTASRINERLMALHQRTRLGHEIRAFQAQVRVVEALTGERLARGFGELAFAAGQGCVAALLERLHGGDVSAAPGLIAELTLGLHRREMRALMPRLLRRADRLRREHDPDVDAAAALRAFCRAARNER